MRRRSGFRDVPHVSAVTLIVEAAEFTGSGIFESTICPPSQADEVPKYDVMAEEKAGCIPYRFTITEIKRLHPVATQDLPACFRGEEKLDSRKNGV